jgi:polysaccharide pyruvyl transferase WcaK-like protein
MLNKTVAKDAVLLGVGCGVNSKKLNSYTKKLYRSTLSSKYIHSVRDDKAKEIVESLGYRAINTGCITLWSLTEENCKKIPHDKSESVIFTLTYYLQDPNNDKLMIKTLKKNYKKVYFWAQCIADYEYLKSIDDLVGISIVPPNLDSYTQILKTDIDYVGNRLHGGIYAMQHGKRAIIITIDYRAREMNKSYNILERNEMIKLENIINNKFETKVNINSEKINMWMSQFK